MALCTPCRCPADEQQQQQQQQQQSRAESSSSSASVELTSILVWTAGSGGSGRALRHSVVQWCMKGVTGDAPARRYTGPCPA